MTTKIQIAFTGLLLTLISTSVLAAESGPTQKGDGYTFKVVEDTKLSIQHDGGVPRIFDSTFTVFFTGNDPKKSMRRPFVGHNQEERVLYKVPTWGRSELRKIDPKEHVMDGFDPKTDRDLEKGRTANYFMAAPYTRVSATGMKSVEEGFEWVYEDQENFSLTARLTVSPEHRQPVLTWELTPKKSGYFSVGYTGAPAVSPEDMDEIWQPLIWQEKRLPNLPYLTEAFLCPLPSALVSHQGVTVGVLADPQHLPFMPLPKSENSQFGIMVRNGEGLAQPALFAPVLGGVGSKRNPGQTFSFTAHLVVRKQSLLETFEFLARETYQFQDIRENVEVTLNTTFENMIETNMGRYSEWNSELRGSNYSTDIPGAVKNVSSLHPLALSIVTANETIFTERAQPMAEYALSRERFLFATNPKINKDGTSARLEGPGAPMSEYSTISTFSQNRMRNYLKLAKKIYSEPIDRSLNLTAQLYGDRWQNAMYLYTATGEKRYLDAAIRGADAYLAHRVEKLAVDFDDKDSRGMFFWTSYTPQWMELYLLYEITQEESYLEAARIGARRYAQLVYLVPTIPDEKVTVNKGGKVPRYRGGRFKDMRIPEETVDAWRVSEIGLTPESSPTSHGHRAIYLAQYAPWMLRIASDTKDIFLHDIARSAIIGRYANFPGYHINAGRTTGHSKADFPLRKFIELNGVTSMHYNHLWPHAALIFDFLVSDVYYRSGGQLDFPSEYAEGYAYCRSKVYGAEPGTFYDGSDMHLYMPKGLVDSSNLQINYLAARTHDSLILMLTNQSKQEQLSTVTLSASLLGIGRGTTLPVELWSEGKRVSDGTLENATVQVTVPAMGLTTLKIGGVQTQPTFQQKIYGNPASEWAKDEDSIDFGGGAYALLFNFGPELQSVYAYTKANADIFKEVEFHYACDGTWKSVKKTAYPFEFTVSVPPGTMTFTYRYEAVTTEGQKVVSEIGTLRKE